MRRSKSVPGKLYEMVEGLSNRSLPVFQRSESTKTLANKPSTINGNFGTTGVGGPVSSSLHHSIRHQSSAKNTLEKLLPAKALARRLMPPFYIHDAIVDKETLDSVKEVWSFILNDKSPVFSRLKMEGTCHHSSCLGTSLI
jgi:hypothetical protein